MSTSVAERLSGGSAESNPFVEPPFGGGSGMRDYWVYCLDRDGECAMARELGAKDDADAIAQAEFMQLQFKCELWDRARLVVELPAFCP
jgi:hypothetical protein